MGCESLYSGGGNEPELFQNEIRSEDQVEQPAAVSSSADQSVVSANPFIYAVLRALYAGGPKHRWEIDAFGKSFYRCQSGAGQILFSVDPASAAAGKGSRNIASQFSVATADTLIILLTYLTRLHDPQRDVAVIDLDEICRLRDLRLHRRDVQTVYDAAKKEVLRLADLHITMIMPQRSGVDTVIRGAERPDRLLDILDIEQEQGGVTRHAFSYRAGQSLAPFLQPEMLQWIGYYTASLLRLSPSREALAKKLGAFWFMMRAQAGKKDVQPSAMPSTVFDFCGEAINWRNPGQTVDRFIEAHKRLVEIGVLETLSNLEPITRSRGYFKEWLHVPFSVNISENLQRIGDAGARLRGSAQWKRKVRRKGSPQQTLLFRIPETTGELRKHPKVIRQFRSDYLIRQEELARTLGVTRQTLSYYERALRPLPEEKAARILMLWKEKAVF